MYNFVIDHFIVWSFVALNHAVGWQGVEKRLCNKVALPLLISGWYVAIGFAVVVDRIVPFAPSANEACL